MCPDLPQRFPLCVVGRQSVGAPPYAEMVAGWEVSLKESMRGMVRESAKSVAFRPLPPVPADLKVEDPKRPMTPMALERPIAVPRASVTTERPDIWTRQFALHLLGGTEGESGEIRE